MATAMETLRPPPTLPPLKGIYAGKYRDRNPDIRAAGLTSELAKESTSQALTEMEKPESPEPTKKFHRTFRTQPGERILFYGHASDPQIAAAQNMTHGMVYSRGEGADKLLNPKPLTLYQQRFLDRMEANNLKNLRRPLGEVPDGVKLGLLPKNFDRDNTVFGITVQKVGSAGELLNPEISRRELNEMEAEDSNTYLVSHKRLLAGEQASRGFVSGQKQSLRDTKWGRPTPHDNTGSGSRKCMHWIGERNAERRDAVVEKRLDDFRERTQPQLGQPLDPIKDTMRVGPDHTFGILHKPDDHGVGDLLHGRAPKHFLRGQDRRRALVAALRTQLKATNYERFDELRQAFEFYDRDCTGKLTADDVRAACVKLSVPLDDFLLEQLIDFCDVDGDGFIDYHEFANFLNWREISVRTQSSFGRLEADPQKLSKQIDQSIVSHTTTNSMYNATVNNYNPNNYRTYGCATIRSDLPAPAVRSVSDKRSYGNEGDAGACLNPSIFTAHGVFEFDLILPRSSSEIKSIFANSKIDIDDSIVDKVFEQAGKSEMGIDEFRLSLANVSY